MCKLVGREQVYIFRFRAENDRLEAMPPHEGEDEILERDETEFRK